MEKGHGSCSLYRKSVIGETLIASLEEIIIRGDISPHLALKVLMQFDKSMQVAIQQLVKTTVAFKGHLHTYRFCDNQWTFNLHNSVVKINDDVEYAPHITIVATDAEVKSCFSHK